MAHCDRRSGALVDRMASRETARTGATSDLACDAAVRAADAADAAAAVSTALQATAAKLELRVLVGAAKAAPGCTQSPIMAN